MSKQLQVARALCGIVKALEEDPTAGSHSRDSFSGGAASSAGQGPTLKPKTKPDKKGGRQGGRAKKKEGKPSGKEEQGRSSGKPKMRKKEKRTRKRRIQESRQERRKREDFPRKEQTNNDRAQTSAS